jgi:hypothetical protein
MKYNTTNETNIKRISILFILLFISLSLLIYIKADILSINSGGSANITINPDLYIDAFNPHFPTASNSTSSSNGTSSNSSSSSGSSSSSSSTVSLNNLSVTPNEINFSLLINTNVQKNISLTNYGSNSLTLNINQTGLANMVIIGNTSLTISPGQTENVSLIFVAPGTVGVYNGTIQVGNITIPVSLNVLKQFILFDTNIVVLNKNYIVPQATPLETAVTLIPMGGSVRMDVTLDYQIKNSNGTIFLTKSETLLVQSEENIRRNFDTGSLPVGNYTISLELIYPNGIAPSSANFVVVSNISPVIILAIYYIMIGIIMIILLILCILIIKYIVELRRQSNFEVEENPNPISKY